MKSEAPVFLCDCFKHFFLCEPSVLNSLQNGIPYDVFKISGFSRKYIEKYISQQYIFFKDINI